MKKIFMILVIISLTRVGVAYAADNAAGSQQNYFFGNTSQSAANLNQVLALLVGPKGDPGPAGVAGRDGFIGMNGKDGKDGLPGAPGAVGPAGGAGAGIAIAQFTGTQGTCSNGGTKFIAGDGTTTYACNGTNGSGGGGGGGSIGYGAGEVSVGSCTDTATVGLKSQYTGADFVFDTITVTQLNTGCASKTLSIYFKIKSSGSLKNSTGNYTLSDTVKCTYNIPVSSSWGTSPAPQLSIGSGNSTCATLTTPLTTFLLNKISTADYTNAIGFEIT